jgi:hypothetical protein
MMSDLYISLIVLLSSVNIKSWHEESEIRLGELTRHGRKALMADPRSRWMPYGRLCWQGLPEKHAGVIINPLAGLSLNGRSDIIGEAPDASSPRNVKT